MDSYVKHAQDEVLAQVACLICVDRPKAVGFGGTEEILTGQRRVGGSG